MDFARRRQNWAAAVGFEPTDLGGLAQCATPRLLHCSPLNRRFDPRSQARSESEKATPWVALGNSGVALPSSGGPFDCCCASKCWPLKTGAGIIPEKTASCNKSSRFSTYFLVLRCFVPPNLRLINIKTGIEVFLKAACHVQLVQRLAAARTYRHG